MKITIKTIGQILTGIAAVATLFAGRAMALTPKEAIEAVRVEGMPRELFGNSGIITNLTSTALAIVGIIAVVMLIFGGIRYIISGGDQKKVTDAKNTVLYAIIGLVISLLSYAIVNFVLGLLGSSATA